MRYFPPNPNIFIIKMIFVPNTIKNVINQNKRVKVISLSTNATIFIHNFLTGFCSVFMA
jgi:hypothetical protein